VDVILSVASYPILLYVTYMGTHDRFCRYYIDT